MAGLLADLVLEGGGVKGIALCGAVSVLEERGYKFNRVAGTSAGAIVGALVAVGYDGKELADIVRSIEYRKFRDGDFLDHLGLLGKGMSLLMEQGIYKGDYLKEWLSKQLDAKHKKTFGDIKLLDPGSTLPVDQQYRLVVMASDISHGELCRFPWSYSTFGVPPDSAEIVEAVRASMSIPFFYAPQKMKSSAGETSWFVDGGMLSNFPIDVFDRTDQQRPRWPTFGIKLSAQPTAAQGIQHKITGAVTLTEAMIGTMTGFYDRMHIDDPSVQARTIFVDTMKVRATDFDIDDATQQQLYESGRAAATRFLDGAKGTPAWDWDTYLEKYWKPSRPQGSS